MKKVLLLLIPISIFCSCTSNPSKDLLDVKVNNNSSRDVKLYFIEANERPSLFGKDFPSYDEDYRAHTSRDYETRKDYVLVACVKDDSKNNYIIPDTCWLKFP